MEALLKLQPVNAMSNVKGIRAVLDNLEIQVRGLQALGIDFAQYGALLIPIFMEKFPVELRLMVSSEHHLAVCNSSMGDSSNNPAGTAASPALHIGSGTHVFIQTVQVNVSIPGKELSYSLTVRAIF